MKIDLGCGYVKSEGWTGVDLYNPNADIKADIRHKIRGLADNCADEVRCNHVLEHLHGSDWRLALSEMIRILKPGGKFEIRVPHPAYDNCMITEHIHVLTPYWWRQLRDEDWMHGKVVIDLVEERLDPVFEKDRDAAPEGHILKDPIMVRYLRNVYHETLIQGHKT